MDVRCFKTWLVVAVMLGGCGQTATSPVVTEDTPPTEVPEETPPEVCQGATEWRYDPLGEDGVHAFPDDVHTVPDEAVPTGRRVAFDVVHDPWMATLEPAVSAVYESLEGLEGWGITAPVVLQFTDALGEPPAWEDSMGDGAMHLLRLGPEGAVYHPCEVQLVEGGTTAVIWPLGPLEPATEYALLVTSDLVDAEGECVAPSPTLRAMLAGDAVPEGLERAAERVQAFAEAAGIWPEALSAAVTFTTQRTTDISEQIAAHIPTESYAWSDDASCEVNGEIRVCERHFTSWDYRLPEAGMDVEPVSPWEIVATIWLPATGDGPWPTIVMGHGINSSRAMGGGIAHNLSDLGVVVVAIDAIGHGDHPTNAGNESFTGMMSFLGIDAVNLRVDGRALRDNLRQSTADRLQLIELLVQDGDLDGDGTLDVDTERMGYVGISLGGIMGSEILALSERLEIGVLITAAARMTSIFTYATNMAVMMDVMEGLTGSEANAWQLIAALQGAIDPGDPLAYAHHVITERLNDGPAPHVLVTMAVGDPVVPNEGTRALAQGLGVGVMHRVVEDMGLAPQLAGHQVSANMSGPTTGALFQFDRVSSEDGVIPADHDNLPYSAEALHQMRHFVSTWLEPETAPEIVDPYPVLGTPEL